MGTSKKFKAIIYLCFYNVFSFLFISFVIFKDDVPALRWSMATIPAIASAIVFIFALYKSSKIAFCSKDYHTSKTNSNNLWTEIAFAIIKLAAIVLLFFFILPAVILNI